MRINPFVLNAPFLYPLKTSENLTVFWYFQVVKKGALGTNGLRNLSETLSTNYFSIFLPYHEPVLDGPDFMWPFTRFRFKHFWFCPIGPLLINATYQYLIWSTWFHETFFERSSIGLGVIKIANHERIWWTWFLVTFLKVRSKHFWLLTIGSC